MFRFKQLLVTDPNHYCCFQLSCEEDEAISSEEDEMPENSSQQRGPFGGWRHRASQFYMLLILFGFPLFSAPCPKGSCSNPVEVVAVHLISKGVNNAIVKAVLYPGALFSKLEAIVAEDEPIGLPDLESLLDSVMTSIKDKGQNNTTFELGLIIGSYLCIAGAIACVLGPTTFSAFGPLVILWSVYKAGAAREDYYLLPMFSVTLFCAVSGVKFLSKAPRGIDSSGPSGDSSSNNEKSSSPSSDKKTK